jgi:hypothetical protein
VLCFRVQDRGRHRLLPARHLSPRDVRGKDQRAGSGSRFRLSLWGTKFPVTRSIHMGFGRVFYIALALIVVLLVWLILHHL